MPKKQSCQRSPGLQPVLEQAVLAQFVELAQQVVIVVRELAEAEVQIWTMKQYRR